MRKLQLQIILFIFMFIINANVFAIEKSMKTLIKEPKPTITESTIRLMTTTGVNGKIIPKAYLLINSYPNHDNGDYMYETLENKTISEHIVNVASLTRSGSIVTVTMPANTPHHYVAGLSQTISNATNPEYNVTAPVISVISKLSYTYKINTTPPTPDGGTNIKSTATFASMKVRPITSSNSFYTRKVPNLVTGQILQYWEAISGVSATATVQ